MNTTNATQINRRHFLAASSVLAAAGLVVLPTISSATKPPVIKPATDAELWAILDRRLAAHYGDSRTVCDCPDCRAIRAASYTCPACGYDGEPFVYPCDCGKQWDMDTSMNAAMLRGSSLTLADRRGLRAWQRRLLRAGRPSLCDVRDPMCAHGGTSCPVCGETGSDDAFEGEQEARAVATMLRDLRAALRTRAAT